MKYRLVALMMLAFAALGPAPASAFECQWWRLVSCDEQLRNDHQKLDELMSQVRDQDGSSQTAQNREPRIESARRDQLGQRGCQATDYAVSADGEAQLRLSHPECLARALN
jgi:hypothetical protein